MQMDDNKVELLFEHLRHIRKKIDKHDEASAEIKEQLLSIRDDLHGIRGDFRRLERGLATVEVDVERIKTRLDLTD